MKKHITEKQRYEISALLQAGKSKSYIAKRLNVHILESRISREKGGERYTKHTLTGKEDKTTEIIYYTCGNLYSDDHGYSE